MFEKEAEEYADRTRIKDKNTYIGFPDESITEVQDYEGNRIDIRERIEKAFKDGATYVLKETNKRIDDFENMKAGLEYEIVRLKEKIESDKELIMKLRLALIKERTANLCNGIDAVKLFDDLLDATIKAEK